jgi:hypothetical protein
MLAEVKLGPKTEVPIRLVGSAIEQRIQHDIKGLNYFDLLDPERHADAAAASRVMLYQPCGVWQVVPFHYERGIAQNLETTVFPLLGDESPYFLALGVPREEFVRPLPSGERAVLAGGPTEFAFLDIGAGLPDWPLR